MGAEADAICGAPYGSRSQQRVNSRDGYRARRIHAHLPHVGRRPLELGGVRAHAVADVTAYRCVVTPTTWRGQEAAEAAEFPVSWRGGTLPDTLGGRRRRPSASEESS